MFGHEIRETKPFDNHREMDGKCCNGQRSEEVAVEISQRLHKVNMADDDQNRRTLHKMTLYKIIIAHYPNISVSMDQG